MHCTHTHTLAQRPQGHNFPAKFFTLKSIPKGKPPHILRTWFTFSTTLFPTRAGHWPPTVRKPFSKTWPASPAMFPRPKVSRPLTRLPLQSCRWHRSSKIRFLGLGPQAKTHPNGFPYWPKVLAQDLGPQALAQHTQRHLPFDHLLFLPRARVEAPALQRLDHLAYKAHTFFKQPIPCHVLLPRSSPRLPHGPLSGKPPSCSAT